MILLNEHGRNIGHSMMSRENILMSYTQHSRGMAGSELPCLKTWVAPDWEFQRRP